MTSWRTFTSSRERGQAAPQYRPRHTRGSDPARPPRPHAWSAVEHLNSAPAPARNSQRRDELVQHAIDRAEADREMAFALLQVWGDAGDVLGQPLTVREGHHQVLTALPEEHRHGDLVEL